MPQTSQQRKASYQQNKAARIAAVRQYYADNKDAIRARERTRRASEKPAIAARNKAYQEAHKVELAAGAVVRSAKTKAFIESVKRRPCYDCGGSFPACAMEIHHLMPRRVSGAAKNWLRWSIARIEAELAKCVIVCANCHSIRDAALAS